MKRQLTESEKNTVRQQQLLPDGSLRCFISGDIISDEDEIEYDHIQPYSKGGDTSTSNIRIVLKKHNRRKSDQSLYEVRDNSRLERLFESKKNNIRLQDILELKDIERRNTHATKNSEKSRWRMDNFQESSPCSKTTFSVLPISTDGYLLLGLKTMIKRGCSLA
jgi:hypothetical protein